MKNKNIALSLLTEDDCDNHLDSDGEIISRNDYLENVYTLFRKEKYSFYKSNERY